MTAAERRAKWAAIAADNALDPPPPPATDWRALALENAVDAPPFDHAAAMEEWRRIDKAARRLMRAEWDRKVAQTSFRG